MKYFLTYKQREKLIGRKLKVISNATTDRYPIGTILTIRELGYSKNIYFVEGSIRCVIMNNTDNTETELIPENEIIFEPNYEIY